jgi:CheY-like chemotaxis protein
VNHDTAAEGEPTTILVIDDNPATRYVIGTWLRRAGHTVLEAEDGTSGLAQLSGADGTPVPDLAIVDVRLPDMSGFEVCERIKGDPAHASLPVVHVSASAIAVRDRTQGLDRGADAYLTEPIDSGELLATVAAVLRYARARRRAERLAARVGVLNRATLAVYAATNGDSFALAAVDGAARLLDSAAAVAAEGPEGTVLLAQATGPGAAPRVTTARRGLLERLAAGVLGARPGAAVRTVPHEEWKAAVSGTGSGEEVLGGDVALAVARAKNGRPPLCLAVRADAVTGDEDRELLTQLASTGALALESLRTYSEEHSLALTLQRTFLPGRLPQPPGTELAVRYLPAASGSEIGGDFYEALETDAGLLLAVGDVAGHSLPAAVVMGELRHALRAYAVEGHTPDGVLLRLDALMSRLHPALTATLCLVLVEPGGRRLWVANAGHMPPLLRAPDGTTGYLAEHGPLLGVGAGLPHPPPTPHEIAPGSILVLFTDGLIEVPGTDLSVSLERLRIAVGEGPAALEELHEHLLDVFGAGAGDDVAILSVRLA